MRVKLGIAPIAWSNDDMPQLGGNISLEQCLGEIRDAGYVGTERGGKFPKEPEKLRRTLEEYGIWLASGWCSGELLTHDVDAEFERIRGDIELFSTCGSPVMVYAETSNTVQNKPNVPLSQRPCLDTDETARYGEKLTRLAEKINGEGLGVSYHPHMGTIFQIAEDVDRLMENTGPAVGLLLDTGHLFFAGADPVVVSRRWGRRINHVHTKDVRLAVLEQLQAQDWSFLKGVREGVFTVPGDGVVDFPSFFALLTELKYQGWIIIESEQDPEKANPFAYAKKGFSYMVQELQKKGFKVETQPGAV